jgi:hypothetical protein
MERLWWGTILEEDKQSNLSDRGAKDPEFVSTNPKGHSHLHWIPENNVDPRH